MARCPRNSSSFPLSQPDRDCGAPSYRALDVRSPCCPVSLVAAAQLARTTVGRRRPTAHSPSGRGLRLIRRWTVQRRGVTGLLCCRYAGAVALSLLSHVVLLRCLRGAWIPPDDTPTYPVTKCTRPCPDRAAICCRRTFRDTSGSSNGSMLDPDTRSPEELRGLCRRRWTE